MVMKAERQQKAANSTNPLVQRRQPHLHTRQPLSQCCDLTPELTPPFTQVFRVPPKTENKSDVLNSNFKSNNVVTRKSNQTIYEHCLIITPFKKR